MNIANAQTGQQAGLGSPMSMGAGLAGAAAGFGLTTDTSVADVARVGGPLLVGEVVDKVGELIGVLGVVDDGEGADVLLAGLLPAAAGELGGVARTGSPVGSGAEIAARFSIPVTTVVFAGDGAQRAVFVAVSDRRSAGSAPNPGDHPGAGVAGGGRGGGLDKLMNVSLEVSVELGRTRVTLADVLDYDVGATIELDRASGAPVDVRVNDTLLAHGEVVLVDDQYAVRLTEILDPNQRQ